MATQTSNQMAAAKNFFDNHELLRKTMKNLTDSYRTMDALRNDGGDTLQANAKNIADIVSAEAKRVYTENDAIIESSLKQFGLTRDDIEQTYYRFNKTGFAVDAVTNQYTRMNSRNWLKQILAAGVQPEIFKTEDRAKQRYYKAEMDDAIDEIRVNHPEEINILSIHQDELRSYYAVMRYIEGLIASIVLSNDKNSDVTLIETTDGWTYQNK